ncbi:MAG TPA: YceI family protein [Bacteroidales bacterium]|nr:YceI family protein [Bacteroidales bacterium]
MRRLLVIVFIISFGGTAALMAQTTYRLASSKSSVVVKGTSTLHDWEMTAKEVSASLTVDKDGSSINTIDNVTFSVKADKIEGESSIMDGKAHDALRSNKYPDISFRMKSVNRLASTGGNISGSLDGDVTIAGVTRNITVPFSGTLSGSTIKVNGSKSLSLSNFNISPPTAMLGTLKTGNDIKIDFKLEFSN